MLSFRRSKKGVLCHLLNRQKIRSQLKGWEMPDYDLGWMYDRFLFDPTFNRLYQAWVDSGYDRWFIPSIDRIDPTLPYTKSNIQMISYRDNARKADAGERARTEVIMCDLDGTEIRIFRSMSEASAATGASPGNIGSCCRDQRYTAKGYRWKYGERHKYGRSVSYSSNPLVEDPLIARRRAAIEFWRDHPSLSAPEVCRKLDIENPKTLYQWRSRASSWREKRRANPYA